MKTSFFILFLFFSFSTFSQAPSQTVRGSVFDSESQFPLTGVKVEVIVEGEELSSYRTATDFNGEFLFEKVPVGKHTLIGSFAMYMNQNKTIEVSLKDLIFL